MLFRNQIKQIFRNVMGGKVYNYVQFRYWRKNIQTGNLSEKEIHALPLMIGPNDIAIDIGAHFGRFTYPLAQIVGNKGHVYSIEPVEQTYNLLNRIIRSLKINNVSLHNLAISDNTGHIEIAIPENSSGMEVLSRSRIEISSGNESSENTLIQTIASQTLDQFVTLNNIQKVNLIKCDVEGAELLVLKGSQKVLQEHHPALILEIEQRHTTLFNYLPEDIQSFLSELGYSIYIFDGNNLLPTEKINSEENNYIFLWNQNN